MSLSLALRARAARFLTLAALTPVVGACNAQIASSGSDTGPSDAAVDAGADVTVAPTDDGTDATDAPTDAGANAAADAGDCGTPCEPPPTSDCIEPPALQSPRVCMVPVTGGECRFAEAEDGIVLFPDQVVTGPVNTRGGRNLHVIGGHIRLDNHEHYAMAFDFGTNIFVEGTYADANDNCDVFAIRNHLAHQMRVTFQNVYATGPTYNNPAVTTGDCHGDLIQNQGTNGGGLILTVENFVGVTRAQGFFTPRYEPTGEELATLRNVYIREKNPVDPTYGLLWFWSYTYNNGSYTEYRADLTNVNVGWEGSWLPILPQTGTLAGDVYDFEHPLITGTVNRWHPDGSDLDYPAHTGLNYDRSFFCTPNTP